MVIKIKKHDRIYQHNMKNLLWISWCLGDDDVLRIIVGLDRTFWCLPEGNKADVIESKLIGSE